MEVVMIEAEFRIVLQYGRRPKRKYVGRSFYTRQLLHLCLNHGLIGLRGFHGFMIVLWHWNNKQEWPKAKKKECWA